MRRRARHNPLAAVLWANAAAVALLAVALLFRGNGGNTFLPAANAQIPVSGGAGLYLMPAQLANNVWGVYLLDVDRQTLMVYRYDAAGPGDLKFLAVRNVTDDRRLDSFNTSPDPAEMKAVADKQRQTGRLPQPAPADGTNGDAPTPQ